MYIITSIFQTSGIDGFFKYSPVSGSKRPPQNHLPDYSNQASKPMDYLDRGSPNLYTTSPPYSGYPFEFPKTFDIQPDQQQQQRTFLLTTLLPICVVIGILVAVALGIIWFLKCRRGNSRQDRKLQGIENEGGGEGDESLAPERVPLKEDKKIFGKKNGLTIANNGNQAENKTPRKSG